eukprot:m.38693 g.38693  ORF g.38693 m.38693 type:complete len:131 (-) comp14662_c0_seq1:65-457(-)
MAASMGGICLMALSFTIGMLMVVLGCALPQYDNWYPLFVIITYILTPIPACAMKSDDMLDGPSVRKDVATFITTALVLSGYGIPWVLWHHQVIVAGAAWLVVSGNTVMFLTILAYFNIYEYEGDGYSGLY